MSNGTLRPNAEVIHRWVQGQAAELTSHRNLKALIAPDPALKAGAPTLLAVGHAAEGLIRPLEVPDNGNNTAFRRAYIRDLLEVMPNLLDKQLHSRTVAMIVLGKTGAPEAVPIFLKVLNDPNQVMMVKLWAARGLTNATDGGRREIPTRTAIDAAQALVNFLNNEKDAHWTVQARALEALGALRQATADPIQGQAEMAGTALRFLSDPKARPDVRAWAAWALGMMHVPQQLNRYNVPLIAYYVGQAAADVGEQVGSVSADSADLAMHLSGLLLSQLVGGLRGVDGVRDSGLLNGAGAGPARSFVQGVNDRVQAVAVAAYKLAGPTAIRRQKPQLRRELDSKVADLRAFLAKNPPADRHLVPGGPVFPGAPAQVAEKPR